MDWISKDLRTAKYVDIENNPVHAYQLLVHNFIFVSLFIIAVVYFGDFWLNGGRAVAELMSWLAVNNSHVLLFKNEPLTLFYYIGAYYVVLMSAPLSFYYFIRWGGVTYRSDFVLVKVFNTAISNFIVFISNAAILIPFFFAGFLTCIVLPSLLKMSYLPGFIILQIMLAIKILSLSATSSITIFLMLYPYGLRRWLAKKFLNFR